MEVSPCEFEAEMDLRRCEKESEEEAMGNNCKGKAIDKLMAKV